VAEVCRKIEVTDQTYFRWRKEYGGMRVDQANLKTAMIYLESAGLKIPLPT